MRPEFLRIQQMVVHEAIGHLLGKAVPVHGPQIIMGHGAQNPVILIPVKAGACRLVPQIGPDLPLYLRRLLLPEFHLLHVVPDSADLRQRLSRRIGKTHNIHGSHGHHAASFRRGLLTPVVGCIPVPEGMVFPGVVFAPGLQAAVPVRIPYAP